MMESGSNSQRVAYLGPQASYTHQAALQAYPDTTQTILIPQTSIAAVFTAVQEGDTALGVVPFENSSNGAVLPTLDLFASLDAQHPDVSIVGEQFVDVHHCLLGRVQARERSLPDHGGDQQGQIATKELTASGFRIGQVTTTEAPHPALVSHQDSESTSLPATDLSSLKTIYSHPQAWGQVRRLLSNLPQAEKIDASSTSAAAAKVAASIKSSPNGTSDEAAIASRLAAEVYDLDILAADVEDRGDNQTRFFILARRDRKDHELEGADADHVGPTKTLLHFRVNSHSDPGALADALAVFKKYGLSLTSMYTRPDPAADLPLSETDSANGKGDGVGQAVGGRWRYIFFVEFRADAGAEEKVKSALKDLEDASRELRVVGRWKC